MGKQMTAVMFMFCVIAVMSALYVSHNLVSEMGVNETLHNKNALHVMNFILTEVATAKHKL